MSNITLTVIQNNLIDKFNVHKLWIMQIDSVMISLLTIIVWYLDAGKWIRICTTGCGFNL